jgi:hypothetical protein
VEYIITAGKHGITGASNRREWGSSLVIAYEVEALDGILIVFQMGKEATCYIHFSWRIKIPTLRTKYDSLHLVAAAKKSNFEAKKNAHACDFTKNRSEKHHQIHSSKYMDDKIHIYFQQLHQNYINIISYMIYVYMK